LVTYYHEYEVSPNSQNNGKGQTGNRQQATGNYTHLLNNRVNYLIALLSSLQKNNVIFSFFWAKSCRTEDSQTALVYASVGCDSFVEGTFRQ
jgi:hypothetical protein